MNIYFKLHWTEVKANELFLSFFLNNTGDLTQGMLGNCSTA
jgi:hypothetical protein